MQKHLRINNQIRIPEVQVIDEGGNQLGKMPTFKALELSKERGLDLVEVGPQTQPPIAKIMDYGKYIYHKERQEKGSVKQKDQEVKTVRIGFKTGKHDLEFKSEQTDKFLKHNHPVQIELVLRGREKALAHLGKEKIENFIKLISEPYVAQNQVKRSPRGWYILMRKVKK